MLVTVCQEILCTKFLCLYVTSQLTWSWTSVSTQLQWDACLVASATGIAATVDQQGNPVSHFPAFVYYSCCGAGDPQQLSRSGMPAWQQVHMGLQPLSISKALLACQTRRL